MVESNLFERTITRVGATVRTAVSRPFWSKMVYVQYGMKRSGNHAVSNWLLPKLDATHFNNIIPMGLVYADGRSVPHHPEFLDWYFSTPVGPDDAGRGPLTGLDPIRHPVYASFEDISPQADMFSENAPTRIVVIRSFENMMSSRIRKSFNVDMPAYPNTPGPVLTQVIEMWKDHALWYLGEHRNGADRIAIHFDHWFQNSAYRDAICARLSVEPGDSGLSRVSDTGGGSSFDGTQFDGNAVNMSLNRRQDALNPQERALFDAVMAHPGVRDLAERVAEADPFGQL